MATTRVVFSAFLLLSSFVLLLSPPSCDAHPLKACMFDSIYQFGDSISDTGNLIRERPIAATSVFARLPYGETFFKNATGRCSNGLLMIDYVALAAGLPFLNPYRNIDADFSHGVNFAVAGSTALKTSVLAGMNIFSPVTNTSLDVQLDLMFTHFNSTCYTDSDCSEKLKRALFMVGEIGGNDYNFALSGGKTIEEAKSIVPDVVQAIKDAARRVIGYGALRVVVPGNFPIGCLPIYLSRFQTTNSAAYDEQHCLKGLNDFAKYHNDHLQKAIEELRQENPNAFIVYGDYYNAFQWLVQNAPLLGFDVASVQKACCGIGGDYDFSLTKMCGNPGVPVCADPSSRISWDGIHLTQEAYKFMAGWLIGDILPKFHCGG
ncbi:hypothetical protein L1049_019664 [Liquidambar formosana]|uniref:Acetylajmalan esterase-like n=1 Tax=Liquidambar formosana TaxID=63359 RepID=A0AAP0XAB6_LIQFO